MGYFMRRMLFLPLSVSVLFGCAKVNYLPMNDSPNDISPDKIEIFSKAPDREYIELGLIKVSHSNMETVMRALRKKARQVRADAIILTDSSSKATAVVGSVIVSQEVITALAIAWR